MIGVYHRQSFADQVFEEAVSLDLACIDVGKGLILLRVAKEYLFSSVMYDLELRGHKPLQ